MIRRVDAPLVVGSGVAGLTVALALPKAYVITTDHLGGGGSTPLAQGGVAVAIGPDDGPALHAADTVAVAGGLAEESAVECLVEDGPDAIRRLLARGAEFDRNPDGTMLLGREAGHKRNRIVHADGDATGAELARVLIAAARASDRIRTIEHTKVVDLVMSDKRVVGIVAVAAGGNRAIILAPAVVLATGGMGHLYDRTTNPAGVAGDGIAMAARVGADLIDLEFVQFHPTALAGGGDPMPLLTEALRGGGATVINGDGLRFMTGVHPDAELAPRDVVARAIWRRLRSGEQVFLDGRRQPGRQFAERFPTVFSLAMERGLDPRRDPLPVSPAAHYFMGGVAVDTGGRTSVPGLWAVGEVSSTGVHGANRLASNSLLEGLVFGDRAARDVAAWHPDPPAELAVPRDALTAVPQVPADLADLRRLMWAHVGVERSGEGLEAFLGAVGELDLNGTIDGRNAELVATLVAGAALRRTESRGAHFRTDHPSPDPRQARRARVALDPDLLSISMEHVA